MIAIIDYGMGNLRSVEKAFQKLGFDARITQNSQDIKNADCIVVPGVGSFPQAIRNLKSYGFDELIIEHIKSGKPYLGICLGMQILFSRSDEGGGADGLDVFKGVVVRFPDNLKVPHIGWNNIKLRITNYELRIMDGIPDNSFFYFVHSYYVMPDDKNIILTTTDYGLEFTSSIAKENIFACQFHPEKSQKYGLKLLANFVEMVSK